MAKIGTNVPVATILDYDARHDAHIEAFLKEVQVMRKCQQYIAEIYFIAPGPIPVVWAGAAGHIIVGRMQQEVAH